MKKNNKDNKLVVDFIEKIKPKKVYDILYNFFEDEDNLNYNEVAIEISSLLTHSLIAVEENDDYFDVLDIPGQIDLLEKYVNGKQTKKDVRKFYEKIFSA